MDKFLQLLQDPFWWISVVVVGLALNVISSYLRDFIDKSASRFISKLRGVITKDINMITQQSLKTESDPIILTIIASSIPSLQLDAIIYRISGALIAAAGYSHMPDGFLPLSFFIVGILLFMWGSSQDALARKRSLMLTYILQRRIDDAQTNRGDRE